MTQLQYEHWTEPLRRHPVLTRLLLIVNRILTYLGYIFYPALLVILMIQNGIGSDPFLRTLLTAGISFVLVSIFRKCYNAPRPYEALAIQPLIHKNTRGKSFPSRHVFSVFVIAMCWLAYCPPVGILLLLSGILMAVIRVLGGVHYPLDVFAGACIGILSGAIGFYLIP